MSWRMAKIASALLYINSFVMVLAVIVMWFGGSQMSIITPLLFAIIAAGFGYLYSSHAKEEQEKEAIREFAFAKIIGELPEDIQEGIDSGTLTEEQYERLLNILDYREVEK